MKKQISLTYSVGTATKSGLISQAAALIFGEIDAQAIEETNFCPWKGSVAELKEIFKSYRKSKFLK